MDECGRDKAMCLVMLVFAFYFFPGKTRLSSLATIEGASGVEMFVWLVQRRDTFHTRVDLCMGHHPSLPFATMKPHEMGGTGVPAMCLEKSC